MNNNPHHHSFLLLPDLIGLGLALFVIALYWLRAARLKNWPTSRSILWTLGILSITFSVIGPLSHSAHSNFFFHMLTHLLLGMLAPLLIVLSAPMTFFLRILAVKWARRLSFILKSVFGRLMIDPCFTSVLNIGGLWILYTTDLFENMHNHTLLYVLIHIHVFLAGFLFTISIISIDPSPHRVSFMYRAVVLIGALASHSILAKYIYVHPPLGVSTLDAEAGSLLMYYGGDLIDGILIFVFCQQWYRMTRPRIKEFKRIEPLDTAKARS